MSITDAQLDALERDPSDLARQIGRELRRARAVVEAAEHVEAEAWKYTGSPMEASVAGLIGALESYRSGA